MSTRRKWRARWIWAPDARHVNAHVLFRADFGIDHSVRDAILYISAESFARVYINGREVTQTSSLSYPTQHYYEQCPVGACLKTGVNKLAVLAWYIGVPSGASCPKDPGLLFELTDGNGEILIGSGDERFRCKVLDAWQGRQRRSFWLNLDLVETLDLRRLPAGFPMVDGKENFERPEIQNSAGVRYVDIRKRDFPKPAGEKLEKPVELFRGSVPDRSEAGEVAHRAAVSEQAEVLRELGQGQKILEKDFIVPPQKPGRAFTVLIDLGDYEKGLPLMTVRGCGGASVDITWLEHLNRPDPAASVSHVYTTDRYILSGQTVDIRPEEWKCGRYLRLTFRGVTDPVEVENFRWQRQHHPLRRIATFNSSSRRLNRIVEMCIKAAALCMHDNIMDCPWRERRQWIGDVQRIGLTNHYAFDDTRLLRAVLSQHVHLQDVNGRMYACLPVFEEYPTQSMEWLRAVMEYERYTGDPTLLQETGDNAEMLHRWFLKDNNIDSNGLLRITQPPVMNFLDNTCDHVLRDNQHRTAFASVNLRYLRFLDDLAEAMDRLDRPWAVEQARCRRAELTELIPKVFLQPETGLLRDCADPEVPVTYSELTHAQAVLADLPGTRAKEWWARFCDYRQQNHETAVVAAGPFGKHHTFEALGRLGDRERIVREILDGWGPMVDAGADASWEVFSPSGSRCHGWGGIVLVALARHVFALDPRVGGFRRTENMAGVRWMECSIHR